MRPVCACLLEFHLVCVRLLTLSFIMFLMWLSGTRLHTKLLLSAHRSSFGKLVCLFIAPVSCVSFYPFKFFCVFGCKFGECFMEVSDRFVVVYFIGESL